MNLYKNQVNGVKETGAQGEGVSPGRCSVDQQHRPGRHQTTANNQQRIKWQKKDNRLLFECYIQSQPEVLGYRKRLVNIWRERNPRKDLQGITEQRLADQVRQIKKKKWLETVEQEEIKEKVKKESTPSEPTITREEPEDNARSEDAPTVLNETMRQEEGNTTEEEAATEQVTSDGNEDENSMIVEVKKRIEEIMLQSERKSLPSLKQCKRSALMTELKIVNQAVSMIPTSNITELNLLMYAAAYATTERMGMIRTTTRKKKEEPYWKRRIQTNIARWRKDISKIEEVKRGKLKLKLKDWQDMNRKYQLEEKGTTQVADVLKQKIRSGSAKIKKYEDRCKQYTQNQMFRNNQKRFYESLEENGNKNPIDMPDPKEATQFWSNIWSEEVTHNEKASWMEEVEKDLSYRVQQANIIISMTDVKAGVGKMANWKAAGPDQVQGFWFKRLVGVRERIVMYLQQCVTDAAVPDWMVTGRTTLIQKDPEKGNVANNYRPIACLHLMWKLLTGIISERLYKHLEDKDLLVNEQKGCRKRSRGTKDQLLIDKAILKNCRRRKTNLAMAWIDYRKAYDMVPHSWISKCLDMVGAADNIKALISNSMKQWKTVLTADGVKLGDVEIKRGIFQGDSLSPLLFVVIMIPLSIVLRKMKAGYHMNKNTNAVNHLLFMDDLKLYGSNKNQLDSLIQTVRIFSEDIRMQFGLDKCAVLEMKRGKKVLSDGIELPYESKIGEVDNQGYKYLGVLQLDQYMHETMKERITSGYVKRVKKLCKSKLNAGNLSQGINTWAVSVIRYTAGIVDWTLEEMQNLDRKTRKIMNMNRCLHSRSNVARLYVSRNEGGRGLMSIEECVMKEKKALQNYLKDSEEPLLKMTLNEKVLDEKEDLEEYKKRVEDERNTNWKGKALHGEYIKQTEDVMDENSWRWLKNGQLKKETEGLIIAAQDQALRTNAIKYKIDKTGETPLCRVCKEKPETARHIVSACPKLAQEEYKKRHDKVALRIHWELAKKHNIEHAEKWYDHIPAAVAETDTIQLKWDSTIYTNNRLAHNRPDITLIDKESNEWTLIDIAVPFDQNIVKTEDEKVERYQDLAFEIKREHRNAKVEVIPVVIGALGAYSKNAKNFVERLKIPNILDGAQFSAILGTAHVLRKVLNL